MENKEIRKEVEKVETAVQEFINAWNKTAYGKLTMNEYAKLVKILQQLNFVMVKENE